MLADVMDNQLWRNVNIAVRARYMNLTVASCSSAFAKLTFVNPHIGFLVFLARERSFQRKRQGVGPVLKGQPFSNQPTLSPVAEASVGVTRHGDRSLRYTVKIRLG